MLTNAGLMNVRFRTHESKDDGRALIRFPSQARNPYNQPYYALGGGVPDEFDKEKALAIPLSSQEQQSESEYMSQGGIGLPLSLLQFLYNYLF
jgi:hypothetical protein